MANEAVLMRETELPYSMVCADGTGIEKGAVLKLSGTDTAILSSGDVDAVAGIAAGEKIASDGNTCIAVYQGGDFLIYASGTIALGQAVVTDSSTSGANIVKAADVNEENILGYAKQAHSGAATQILVKLQPMNLNLA